MKKNRTAQQLKHEPESSPTTAPRSPARAAAKSLPSLSNPPAGDFPPSYRPPGAVPSTRTPPPSATGENPSLTKSLPTSPPAKRGRPPGQARCAEETRDQKPDASEEEPAKDPVQGSGGVEYLEYAARQFPMEKFRDYYEHRAAHLLRLHSEKLSEHARASLAALIP